MPSRGQACESTQTTDSSHQPHRALLQMQADAEREQLLADLQDRALKFETAAEISHAASGILEPDELMQQVVDLVCERFELYYVGLFVVDDRKSTSEPGRWAVLRAGTGKAGQAMIQAGHRLEIGEESMIGQCVAQGQARIALDAGGEIARFDNPLLPLTRSEMALPLISRNRVLGAMTIQSAQPAAFTEADITVLQTIADQLANAIENTRLFREHERRITEMAIVNEIGQSLSSAWELDRLLETVHQQVSRLFDATNFYIATYTERDDEWTSAFHQEGGQRQPTARHKVGAGLTGYIIRNGKPLLFRTAKEIASFCEAHAFQAIGELACSWLGVPLIVADKLMGVMAIQSYEHESLYNDQDLALFSTIAAQVASALENLRLLEETRRRARGMELINEIGRTVTSVLDVDHVLREIVDTTKTLFRCYFVSIALVEGDRLVFRQGSAIGDASVRLEPGQVSLALQHGSSLMAEAARTGQPTRVDYLDADPTYLPIAELSGIHSELAVPINVKGRVIGTLDVQSDKPSAFDETDTALLQSLASHAGVAIENARLFRETENALVETETLYNTSRLLTSAGDFQEILAVAAQGIYAPGINRALLWDVERGADGSVQGFTVLASWHSGAGMPPLPVGTHSSMAHLATPLALSDDFFSEDIESEAELAPEIKTMFVRQRTRALAVLPLWISGRQVGTLMLQGEQPHRFAVTEIRRYGSLARQMAAVVENRRLFEQTQQQLANLAVIQTTIARLTGAASFEEAIDVLLPQLSSMVQAETVSMLLREKERMVLAGVFTIVERDDLRVGQTLSLVDYPLTQRAIETRQPLAFKADDPRIPDYARQTFKVTGVTAVAIIPLVGREGLLGTLSFYRYQAGRGFTEREITLVQMLADQAATVFEKSRLLEQVQRRTVQLDTAVDVSRAASSILDPAELMQRAVELIGDRFGLYYAGLFLVDETGERTGEPGQWAVLRAGTGEPGRQMVAEGHKLEIGGNSMVGACLENLQPRIAMDVGAEPVRFQNPRLPETRTELALPLVSRGKPIGALTIQSDQQAAFSTEDIAVFGTMADQLANAIENARLLKEAQAFAEEQAILRRITQAVGQTLEMQDLLETTLDTVLQAAQFDAGLVTLWDEASGRLCLMTQRGLPEPMVRKLERDGLVETLCGFVFDNNRAVGISDVRRGAPVDARGLIQHGLYTYASTPLVHADQRLGVLCCFNRSVRALEARDLSLLQAIGRQIGDGVHNARLYQQTEAALAEVEATHRSYLRRSWEEHLRQREILKQSIFAFEPGQTGQPEDPAAQPHAWRPEMELAVAQGSPAAVGEQGESGTRSGLASPITVRGQTIGVLGVETSGGDHQWTEDDIALIQAVSDQLGQTLETARLFADTQRRAERERLIGEITAKIRASTDVQGILEAAAVELGQALGTSRALVRLGSEESDQQEALREKRQQRVSREAVYEK